MVRTENIQTQGSDILQDVYNKYGSMLYGYLLSVLKDKSQADKYMIIVFDDLSKAITDTGDCGPYTWCGLYKLAKSKLLNEFDQTGSVTDNTAMVNTLGAKMYEGMNDLQRQVFYESYYSGKKVAELSKQFDQSEDIIRKTLKEAFIILRKSGN